MSTPQEDQIRAFLEMSELYIAQCDSLSELDALGHEIADLKLQVGAQTRELENVRRKYLAKRKELA